MRAGQPAGAARMTGLRHYLPVRFEIFARYAVSGGTATAIHYTILVLLVELAGADETLSTTVGYFLSGIVHYLLLYHWAFRSSVRHRKATIRFFLLAVCTLCLNSAIFWILFELAGLWYLFAQLVTTGLILSITFTVNSRYTFARE